MATDMYSACLWRLNERLRKQTELDKKERRRLYKELTRENNLKLSTKHFKILENTLQTNSVPYTKLIKQKIVIAQRSIYYYLP